ncbi:hypothetical protein TIFTF001_016933 [Ficus carica]|uniref:Uncharacterized protein n=1 Tax=Ficus carica TaxID=3494 RepID=A0AA88A192_FICCA|nr:hypothetical protein TIFTF001_016933 [Ficus carica]
MAMAASEALRTISPVRQRFTSSIAMCRQRARISNDGAMADALGSFRMRSLVI